MRAGELLDAAARERLADVVAEIERDTEGEVVLVVVSSCDEYGAVGWQLGVSLAALAFLVAAGLAPGWPLWTFLGVQVLALAAGHGLARLEPLRRALLPAELVETRLAERARRTFAERGLERTRGRTGILLLVAVLERRVLVMGDSGIDAVLDPDESWQEVIDLAVAGLHAGRAEEGLEAALRRCGEMLRRHVPASGPRSDQLPNAVVVED